MELWCHMMVKTLYWDHKGYMSIITPLSSLMVISAPPSTRYFTIVVWAVSTATCSGVLWWRERSTQMNSRLTEFWAELMVLIFPYCKGFKAGNSSFKQHKLPKILLRISKACLVKYVFHIYHLSSSSVMFSEYQSAFKLIACLIPRCLCVGGEKRV